MSDQDQYPLDSFLTMARTAAKVMAIKRARLAYDELMEKLQEASLDWGVNEHVRKATIKVYDEEYRKWLRFWDRDGEWEIIKE